MLNIPILRYVVLLCDIPDEVSGRGSWYTGDAMVMFKEGTFESSSPLCHSTIVDDRAQDKPSIWMVDSSDVQMALTVLFRKLDLNYL